MHCLKYGLTLHNVLKVRGFDAAGEPVTFGSDALDTPGIDLLPLVMGSEGMLAVAIEVTVKLLHRPKLARCLIASFADVEAAGRAVAAVIAAGIIPAGLELMDRRMTAAVESFVHGIGVEKLNSKCVQFSDNEREGMFALKRAFDPLGLLNPGRLYPGF